MNYTESSHAASVDTGPTGNYRAPRIMKWLGERRLADMGMSEEEANSLDPHLVQRAGAEQFKRALRRGLAAFAVGAVVVLIGQVEGEEAPSPEPAISTEGRDACAFSEAVQGHVPEMPVDGLKQQPGLEPC